MDQSPTPKFHGFFRRCRAIAGLEKTSPSLLDVPVGFVRINGLFHLLINGIIYKGYNRLTLRIQTLPDRIGLMVPSPSLEQDYGGNPFLRTYKRILRVLYLFTGKLRF